MFVLPRTSSWRVFVISRFHSALRIAWTILLLFVCFTVILGTSPNIIVVGTLTCLVKLGHFLLATEPLNFFCTIEPKKSSRPRIKFLGASDDEDSEKEEQLERDKRSAVKPAEKSKRKPVFADEVFSRPKVSAHLYTKCAAWRYNFFLCCGHSWDRENAHNLFSPNTFSSPQKVLPQNEIHRRWIVPFFSRPE